MCLLIVDRGRLIHCGLTDGDVTFGCLRGELAQTMGTLCHSIHSTSLIYIGLFFHISCEAVVGRRSFGNLTFHLNCGGGSSRPEISNIV